MTFFRKSGFVLSGRALFFLIAALLYALLWWNTRTQPEQTNFKAEVTVHVEFDGKPYILHEIVICRRMAVRGELFHTTYGYAPDTYAFGVKTITGEAILVTTPAVCGLRKWAKNSKSLDDWTMPIPEGHIPLLAVANKATSPSEIIVYASHQAYKSPNARLQFKGMSIQSPSALKLKALSQPIDDWSYLGAISAHDNLYVKRQSAQDSLYKSNPLITKWQPFGFVRVSKDVWSNPEKGLYLGSEWIEKLNALSDVTLLHHDITARFKDPAIFHQDRDIEANRMQYGYGVFPGPLLDGTSSKWLVKTSYYDEMIPLRWSGDSWVPDVSSQGRLILFKQGFIQAHSFQIERGQLFPTIKGRQMWARSVNLDGKVIRYEFSEVDPRTNISELILPAVYLPSTKSVYVPVELPNIVASSKE